MQYRNFNQYSKGNKVKKLAFAAMLFCTSSAYAAVDMNQIVVSLGNSNNCTQELHSAELDNVGAWSCGNVVGLVVHAPAATKTIVNDYTKGNETQIVCRALSTSELSCQVKATKLPTVKEMEAILSDECRFSMIGKVETGADSLTCVRLLDTSLAIKVSQGEKLLNISIKSKE